VSRGRWSLVASPKLCGRVPSIFFSMEYPISVYPLLELPLLLGNGAIDERRLQVF